MILQKITEKSSGRNGGQNACRFFLFWEFLLHKVFLFLSFLLKFF